LDKALIIRRTRLEGKWAARDELVEQSVLEGEGGGALFRVEIEALEEGELGGIGGSLGWGVAEVDGEEEERGQEDEAEEQSGFWEERHGGWGEGMVVMGA
jgi:hypothetical protein